MEDTSRTATVKVTNIPKTVVANDLYTFFESIIGNGCIYACEIFTEHTDWKPKGHGRLQFETLDQKSLALDLSNQENIIFKGSKLSLSSSLNDIISRPVNLKNRLDNSAANSVLYTGFMLKDDCMCVLESWDGVKTWVLPERERIEFWFDYKGECYKLEFQFGDILETCRCFFEGGKPNAVLLKLKHAPKLYQKVSGSNVASKFTANCNNRYHYCKEDFEFSWIRTTDFSCIKSIGHSSSLCLELDDKFFELDVFDSLPYYEKELIELLLEDGEEFCAASELVPLVKCQSDVKVAYEILFQLNSLVHTHKISLAAIDRSFMKEISKLCIDSTLSVLQKMHKLQSTCYDPWALIKMKLHVLGEHEKKVSTYNRLMNQNIMSCHRVLVTPTKIYCLGPELEASNYIVKNFGEYASDFIRVTFVDEDWGKLPANSVSTFIERGIFAKPYRTKIYHRILSVLRDGIPIGDKRFFFLAFSASQLRSNSVWMFSSNENVKVEDIRNWMGCFNKIRSVSKCAARMGQLFSASKQTYEVLPQHVEVIPDIEMTTDGVDYCFSDGIGKISQSFARQVAQKCGLQYTPSAFQIRYGGYKGVIAVDRNSYRKLSLRSSMLKFESKNCMLNVTKWCESQPCYLNREIIGLLSTLGIDDEAFLALQDKQLRMLDKMLSEKEAALQVLESMGMNDTKSILAKMLRQGYEPGLEPYLSMMLQSHRENQASDLRSRCRVFVQKGRVLLGCLDETGVLNYGQVYVRITLSQAELHCADQAFFQKVDDTTCIVKGKVLVTKNPCLHPGDIRVLEAVYELTLEEKGIVDCILFPQKGVRPHPNECSGGDLDGDLYFVSWDETLIPHQTVAPMDYTGRHLHKMDHDVTQEEIHKFFVDYMINDTLGAISTAHLVHADCEPEKALSKKCLQLATLHSMAVDFAKTGAPAEMPRYLKPREYPDFMQRWDKPMYVSQGVLGKLYRATIGSNVHGKSNFSLPEKVIQEAYDEDLVVDGFEDFLEMALNHKEMYLEKIDTLLKYYGAGTEDEILTGNLWHKSVYLQRDNRRYGEVKDRILVSAKNLYKEAKGWFNNSCVGSDDCQKLASAWYHVAYHPTYCHEKSNCLGFPWIVGDTLLEIKSARSKRHCGTSSN